MQALQAFCFLLILFLHQQAGGKCLPMATQTPPDLFGTNLNIFLHYLPITVIINMHENSFQQPSGYFLKACIEIWAVKLPGHYGVCYGLHCP